MGPGRRARARLRAGGLTLVLTLRDVPGLSVGHATDAVGRTGVTVVLAEGGATAGVDARGHAPGTRETDLLRPTALVDRVHAICLAGGSAFGLAAADGVVRYLAERGVGFDTGLRPVPIVPAAILFDLGVGDPDAHPGPDVGRAAAVAAEASAGPLEGAVGAGTGATVGKLAGLQRAVPAGVGSAGEQLPDGSVVAALAVNNAVGNVVARDGTLLAGVDPAAVDAPTPAPPGPGTSTVLVVVGTDATLDRAACQRVAGAAHDGIARAIEPAHTLLDGDVVFALSTARRPAPSDLPAQLRLEAMAAVVVRAAIERSVRHAPPHR